MERAINTLSLSRTTRRTICGLAITGAIVAIAGCSNSTSTPSPSTSTTSTPMSSTPAPAASGGSGNLIAFVTNNPSQYWSLAHGGVNKAIGELNGVQVQFVMPSDGTAATQKQDVDDLVAKGVKAIAISPVDPTNQTPWINSIAAKIPVITQDSDAASSKRLCYIGSDNHAAGVMCGGLIKKALPQGGKIMLFVGIKDAQNAHDRIAGIEDAIKGTNITVVDVRTDNTDHAAAKTNAADAMIANPDLAAEVGIWSYNGPAIASAVQDAHKVGKVKIICFDQEDATIAGIKSGVIFGTVVQDPFQFGYRGTKMLAQLANGDKSSIPASGTIYVPTLAVDSKSVNAYSATLDKEKAASQ